MFPRSSAVLLQDVARRRPRHDGGQLALDPGPDGRRGDRRHIDPADGDPDRNPLGRGRGDPPARAAPQPHHRHGLAQDQSAGQSAGTDHRLRARGRHSGNRAAARISGQRGAAARASRSLIATPMP